MSGTEGGVARVTTSKLAHTTGKLHKQVTHTKVSWFYMCGVTCALHVELLLFACFTCVSHHLCIPGLLTMSCRHCVCSSSPLYYQAQPTSCVKMEAQDGAGPARKRKRGVQQRLAAHKESKSIGSVTHSLLMSYFAAGLVSGVMVNEIAKATKEDTDKAREGFLFPDLEQTASVKHSKNMSMAITRTMNKMSNLPEGMTFDMPYKKQSAPTSIYLPHELFAYLFSVPALWARCIVSSLGDLRKLWNVFKTHPCMENHPCKQDPDYMSTTVPLLMHGDEVPVVGVGKVWCQSAIQFSWTSILTSGCTGATLEESLFYIWGAFERFAKKGTPTAMGTMEVFFSVMLWSFRILAEGKWPTHDWTGKKHLGMN